jgi:CxxC motif-containing protein (DUF1111 family)
MGSLGDGIAQGAAGPREFRTSPLWGLRMQSSFLHDGRASSIEAAILMHDGEAAPSREFYIRSLPRDQQLELLEYLLSIEINDPANPSRSGRTRRCNSG